jgi:hypothetical protein
VALTTHLNPAPRLKKGYIGITIPPRAFIGCYRVNVTMFSVVAQTTLNNDAANSSESSITVANQGGVI